MADGTGFSEILRSPLDEPGRPGVWWPVLAGMIVGGLVVVGGYTVARSDAGAAASTSSTATVAGQSGATTGLGDVPFPPGYETVSDVVAARPEYAIKVGGELFVAVATVIRRGFDASGVTLDGGSWTLETGTGELLTSTAVVSDPLLPGVVSVVFPDPGDAGLERLRLIERWEPDGREGSETVAVDGAAGEWDELASVDLGGGVTLEVTRLELTERGGIAEWSLTGSPLGGDVAVFVTARREGQDLGSYFSSTGFFLQRRVVRPATEGVVVLTRAEGGGELGDVAVATDLLVEVSATLLTSFPADVAFDVTGLVVATP